MAFMANMFIKKCEWFQLQTETCLEGPFFTFTPFISMKYHSIQKSPNFPIIEEIPPPPWNNKKKNKKIASFFFDFIVLIN